MHQRLGLSRALEIKCRVHTAGICCLKMPRRCDRCDWTRGATETAEGKASDAIAVIFSIIPGLGHIYKGHKLAGFLWMFGAIPVGIFVLLAAFASAGWGLGLFFFYLIAVMLHAYAVDDRVAPPERRRRRRVLITRYQALNR